MSSSACLKFSMNSRSGSMGVRFARTFCQSSKSNRKHPWAWCWRSRRRGQQKLSCHYHAASTVFHSGVSVIVALAVLRKCKPAIYRTLVIVIWYNDLNSPPILCWRIFFARIQRASHSHPVILGELWRLILLVGTYLRPQAHNRMNEVIRLDPWFFSDDLVRLMAFVQHSKPVYKYERSRSSSTLLW